MERWAERIGEAKDRVEQWEASADPASLRIVHGVAAAMLEPMSQAEPGTVDNDVQDALRSVLTELLTGVGETREIADGRDIAELMNALYGDFAALLDIPSTDPSWLRSRARTASWFDPDPVPLRPDQWENLRQAEPDFSVQSELREVAGNSTPRSIESTAQMVRYDVRRIKVEGRWVQEYTLKFSLVNDSHTESIDHATCVEKVRAAADLYFNQGYRLPSGEQFHVRVEFPDDPENADQTISQDSSMQASLLTYTDVEGSDARLARLLGLHLGILDETPQQRELEKDERGVFYRDDMPVSKNQRIPIPRRNRVYGDESVMWLGSRSGRLLPRHLARLEESTRAYGFRPEAADAGSPTLAAIRPEDFGSVAQWRARTLDTLLSQKDIDVDSVMDALRSVRGKGFAVEGLYRAFQAHTGRELDSVLADVLGGEDAAYAAQLLRMQPDSPDTGDPEPPFTSVPPGLDYKTYLRRDVLEYAAAVHGHVSTGLGASDPVVREQSFEAAMRLMRALDRELRKIWAVQLAYNVQFGSSLRDDLIQLRGDQYELIGDVLGDVDSQPASTEQIFEWYRKLKDTTFENYSLGRTPVRHDHPENGCWLRAHAWAMDLRRMGADAMKIFVIRDRPRLSIYSPYLEGALPGIPGKIEPQYHVAPMVQGHTDSGPRLWVLDRAVSANSDDHDGRPLTMEEWLGQLGVDAYDRESVTYLGGPAEQVQQWFTEYCSTMPTTTYSNGQVYPDGRAVVLVVPAHFYWPPVPGVPEQIPGSLLGADLAFRDEESKLIEMNRTAERRARQRLEEAPGVFAADGSRPRPVGEPGAPVPGGEREESAGLADSSGAVAASGPQAVAPEATSPQAASAAGGPQSAATTRDGGADTRDTGGQSSESNIRAGAGVEPQTSTSDPDSGAVFPGQQTSSSAMPGHGGLSSVDSVAVSLDDVHVGSRVPGMGAAERSLRRATAARELQVLSDQAYSGLEDLSELARASLLANASEQLGAPVNGSTHAVRVMAYHTMLGVGDDQIAQLRDRLARIWADLMAVSAGAGPEPGRDPGAGPESVGDAGAVPAPRGDVRSEPTGETSGDAANDDAVGDVDEAELQRLRDRLSRLAGEDEGTSVERAVSHRTVDDFEARWAYLAADGEFGDQVGLRAAAAVQQWMGERPEGLRVGGRWSMSKSVCGIRSPVR